MIIGGLYAFLWAKGKELLVQVRVKDMSTISRSIQSEFVSEEDINFGNKSVLLVHIEPHRESNALAQI